MTIRSRRGALWLGMALIALITACGPGQVCESDADRIDRENRDAFMRRQFEESLRQQQTGGTGGTAAAGTAAAGKAAASATGTAAATGGAAGTAAPTKAPDFGTPSPTATTAAASPFSGRIGLGFDHPPFAAGNGGLGGASAAIVCGAFSGAPPGAIVTVNLSGGTGAPASVTGPIAGDGAFSIPFPINSYGTLNATVGGVKTAAGAALTGSVPAASLEVGGGPDVACTPK